MHWNLEAKYSPWEKKCSSQHLINIGIDIVHLTENVLNKDTVLKTSHIQPVSDWSSKAFVYTSDADNIYVMKAALLLSGLYHLLPIKVPHTYRHMWTIINSRGAWLTLWIIHHLCSLKPTWLNQGLEAVICPRCVKLCLVWSYKIYKLITVEGISNSDKINQKITF